MAVIRNREECIKRIEKALNKHKDKIAWVKVDSVEIKNLTTGKMDKIEDLYFYATGKGSGRPRIICGYRDSRNIYILHDEIAHVNVGSWHWSTLPDSRCNKFITREFCNPVKEIHIWENPTAAEKILKGNLTDKNPDSPMRSGIKCTHATSSATFITDEVTQEIIKNDATFEQLYAKTYDVASANENRQLYMLQAREALLADKNLCYAYLANANEVSPMYTWRLIDKSYIDSGDYITQDYYKTYDYTDLDKDYKIPKKDIDVCCVGLGSAGSNILEQMARLNYFEKYEVIDFDRVEYKNLRNQIYSLDHVRNTKTSALKNILTRYRQSSTNIYIDTKTTNYEIVDYSLSRYKYVISGFDNIRCRKGLLDKIKSGEIEAKYLIDARYDGLTSSLFVIDLSNKGEVDYYEKLLIETDKELNDINDYNWTDDLVRAHMYDCIHQGRCAETAAKIGLKRPDIYRTNICAITRGETFSCGGTQCIECIKQALIDKKIPIPKNEGCLAENIIHIYKLTSAWVTSAIRSLETENKKYFTHVDITVDPVPREIIIRK